MSDVNKGVFDTKEIIENEASESPQEAPPCDRGLRAWLFLVAASVTIMITWGFSAAFGVFRQYYFDHEPFAGNQSIALIGVMGLGFLQAMTPILISYLHGRPGKRKLLMCLGLAVIVACSIGGAFSKTPVQLIMTLGVLYGIGGSLFFAPCMSFMDEWFIKRRGLANGLYFGASSVASAILSPVFSVLLAKFEPRNVLLGWAVISALLLSVAIFCIQPRFGNNSNIKTEKVKISYTYVKQPLFWLLSLATILQALAHYLPGVYLPTYAVDVGQSAQKGSLLITYFNIACIICQPLLGHLADKVGPALPLILSTGLGSIAVFVFWGLFRSYWSMVITVLMFGGFSGGFVVLRSHFARAIAGRQSNQANRASQELHLSSVLLFVRGIATIMSGFVGRAAVENGSKLGIQSGYGAGEWRPLILTIGSLMAVASLGVSGFLGKRTKEQKEEC